jgi:hypothetical protein
VIIVVPSYLEVDSFALLSKNRFSVLHHIKCLKSPERDIDLKSLMLKCPIHELPSNIVINNFYARPAGHYKDYLDA